MRYSYETRNLCYKVNETIPVSGKRFLKCTNIEPWKVIQNLKNSSYLKNLNLMQQFWDVY